VGFEHATRAAKGGRRYQEDTADVRADAGGLTVVLADGMGGHVGGALASELACRHFLNAFAMPAVDVRAHLDEGLQLANLAIASRTDEDPKLAGMGCTLIGVAFRPDPHRLEWVSVGDSPLYLVRNGEIVRLNEDHSLAPELDKLAAAGRISWDAARADPRRHVLRSALTGTEIDLIDRPHSPLTLEPADVVVLASDGIHSISEADIAGVVAAAPTPDAAAEALLAAVEAVGETYQDNTTVVVVRVS
jgi:serine/threonine protein phosphatase PrpC